jgi:XcyI restriction endonuclease
MAAFVHNELTERYLKRAALFWKFTRDAKLAHLQKEARSASWKNLKWNWTELGISADARTAADKLGLVPSEIFAHPEVVAKNPDLLKYYRLLACLPAKGVAQIRKKSTKLSRISDLCVLLNQFLSRLVVATGSTNRETLLGTMHAEAGSEWQGTWVNNIGKASALELERIIIDFAHLKGLVAVSEGTDPTPDEGVVVLKSGTTIAFGSEPDVEFRNAKKELACVIEIKGSADKAGAQTRLGETKKSFTKAKQENARCHTIFLPSVSTAAVKKQLETERDIDQVFDLLDIFRDAKKRRAFLIELFRYRLREKV